MRGSFVLVTVAALAGCYDPPKPNCTFTCDPSLPAGQQCPADYTCVAADQLCHLTVSGAPAPCPEVLPDANGDATDAPIDGAADAPADAPGPDAAFDSSIDASVPDASVPDAATIDAMAVPDAATIDAMAVPDANLLPDAALPDAMVDDVEVIGCSGQTLAETISAATGAYVPMSSTVTVGDVVRFQPGSPNHDMVSGTPGNPDGEFNTPTGSTVCLRFNRVASYDFFCSVHMFVGSITVDP